MTDSSAKTYIFVVRFKYNPQWDRALFLYYSTMRGMVTKWKICPLTYNKKGADVDSKHPLDKGSAEHNELICNLKKNDGKPFAEITFTKPLRNMVKGDKADYTDTTSGRFHEMEVMKTGDGELFEAYAPQMAAAAA